MNEIHTGNLIAVVGDIELPLHLDDHVHAGLSRHFESIPLPGQLSEDQKENDIDE
jgi:hypothetical protein